MDFQAVIKAILNKGDVESQLANLVKDRDVHINPTVGTSGSTNTTLNNQIKRQANAQAKSYVQYSKSAIQKQMKHASFKFHYDSINSRPKIIPLFKPKNVSILSTSSKFNISFLSLIIYFCNTSYFRRFRLLSIPYIFCTIMGRQKPPNFSS